MAASQSGEGRMMIDSIVWAQYINVKDTQTATATAVTGHPLLPLWSTQLLACVEILELSADSFETRI